METTDYLRVLREDAHRLEGEGWRLAAGWFRRCSGLEWAWFEREAGDG